MCLLREQVNKDLKGFLQMSAPAHGKRIKIQVIPVKTGRLI
jgi:hypothetical protein